MLGEGWVQWWEEGLELAPQWVVELVLQLAEELQVSVRETTEALFVLHWVMQLLLG